MTMPDERYRSIVNTNRFLTELMLDKKLPEKVRETARWCLRHYPTQYDLNEIAEALPHVLQQERDLETAHRPFPKK